MWNFFSGIGFGLCRSITAGRRVGNETAIMAMAALATFAAGWYFLYRCGEELEDGGCGKRGK